MQLITIDWALIIGFFVIALGIGLWSAKFAGKDTSSFFLSGRHMPWWLLGFSMVATTFSTDTPNLVTDIVRKDGVAGNWCWWAFLITGMLTVFIYAKLWRRSNSLTDIEFYELRYSGKSAAFLRGFRAIYLGFFFNIMIMAGVTLAAIKIGGIMLGLSPMQTILIASIVTVVFSAIGGFHAVILTDFVLFIIAMVGAVVAAIYAVKTPEVNGLHNLLSNPNVAGKLSILPSLDISTVGDTITVSKDSLKLFITILLIPIIVQWWSVWYPGAEPGGGGYLAQRMLAAKDEKHATGAVLFFNAAHYALRPWPWILVALASLVVFPIDKPKAREEAGKLLKTPVIEFQLADMAQKEKSGLLPAAEKAKLTQLKLKFQSTKKEYEKLAAIKAREEGMSPQQKKRFAELAPLYVTVEDKMKVLIAKNNAGDITEAEKKELVALKTLYATTKGCSKIYERFPNTPKDKIGHDLGYSAMLTFVPHGWIGLIMASLIAAYMSTISTHLNWGSSYIVNDWYQRFIKPEASQKELVMVGRVSTVLLMILTAVMALWLQNAKQLFDILLQVGAGTGLLFILRWFWWRISAVSEITAMVSSFLIALLFKAVNDGTIILPDSLEWVKLGWLQLPLGVLLTTICWLVATFLTKPSDDKVLRSFIELTNPGGPGWRPVMERAKEQNIEIKIKHDAVNLPAGIICMILGCLAVYGALFGIGKIIYAQWGAATILLAIAAISTGFILKLWDRVIK